MVAPESVDDPVPKSGRSSRWIVFTDLDGTLLDHDSYDWSPARPALDRLRRAAIPLVPASSKTLAELERLRLDIGLDGPAIGENGCALWLPGDWLDGPARVERFGPDYAEIRAVLAQLRDADFDFFGFADMNAEEVAAVTGLTPADARLAMRREASEPLQWRGDDRALSNFRNALAKRGLRLLLGGRFLHVMGACDKASAMRRLCDRYAVRHGCPVRCIALGDSPNDAEMLAAADVPIVIRRPDGSALSLPTRKDAIISEVPGPEGWNQALSGVLDRIED
jgi:mannosyl-3-phosphoglycerate phosphatase